MLFRPAPTADNGELRRPYVAQNNEGPNPNPGGYRPATLDRTNQNWNPAPTFGEHGSRPSTSPSTPLAFGKQYQTSNAGPDRLASPGNVQSPFTHDRGRSTSEMILQGGQTTPMSNTGATRSPYLRPQSSTYSLNQTQLSDTNRNTSPAPPRKTIPVAEGSSPPKSLSVEDTAYLCDACLVGFDANTPRFHCSVCEEYDLCPFCYQKNLTSKGHSTGHKVMSISKTHELKSNDITPANVIPEKSPPRVLPN